MYIEGKVSHTPKEGGRNCALDTAGSKTHMDYKGDQIKSVYLTFDSVGMYIINWRSKVFSVSENRKPLQQKTNSYPSKVLTNFITTLFQYS